MYVRSDPRWRLASPSARLLTLAAALGLFYALALLAHWVVPQIFPSALPAVPSFSGPQLIPKADYHRCASIHTGDWSPCAAADARVVLSCGQRGLGVYSLVGGPYPCSKIDARPMVFGVRPPPGH
jgi:hypothetical protein